MNRQTASTFKPLAAALLAALGIAPLAVQAATIVVTRPGDAGLSSDCTLRQAIVSMNAGAVTGTGCKNTGGNFGSSDTINFDTGIFPSGSQNTITLASGMLSITDANLTIDATDNGNVSINGSKTTQLIYDASNTSPVGSLTLNHMILYNGNALSNSSKFGYHGGAICVPYANLTLSNSTVSNNSAGLNGGGIFTDIAGNVTVINSTIKDNLASDGPGGGIFTSIAGNVTLINSTVSGNVSGHLKVSADIPGVTGHGGGIYTKSGHITLTNSTLSGNSAVYSGLGGGIYSLTQVVTLTDSTVSNNSADSFGGGIHVPSGTTTTLVVNNSIVAGNSGIPPNTDDISGGSISGANNLIGGSPMLGALANNGGPTWTMMPQTGSPAINAAPCLAGIATDQRGYIRPDPASRNSATPCDIGAVEVGSISDEIFYNGFEP